MMFAPSNKLERRSEQYILIAINYFMCEIRKLIISNQIISNLWIVFNWSIQSAGCWFISTITMKWTVKIASIFERSKQILYIYDFINCYWKLNPQKRAESVSYLSHSNRAEEMQSTGFLSYVCLHIHPNPTSKEFNRQSQTRHWWVFKQPRY